MGSFFREGILPPQASPAEATGSRAPPPGLAAVFEQIKGAFSSVTGFLTDALKDAAGTIKSLFIKEPSSAALSSGFQFELETGGYLGELGLDSQGNPLFYKPLGLDASIEYRPTQTGERIRFDLDGGDLQFFKFDPNTKFIGQGERVGNLETKPSFVEGLRGFADQADLFLDNATEVAFNFYGPVGISPVSTQLFLSREYSKGLIDTLRFGDQFSAIKSDFLSAQASFQKGDYLDAARGFGSAGLRGFTEGGRIANLFLAGGLATKGLARGIGGLQESAAKLYLQLVKGNEWRSYFEAFEKGTARLKFALGSKQYFRAANSEGAAAFGEFASSYKPISPVDAIRKYALDPKVTGNRARHLFEVVSRPFRLFIEGKAAAQSGPFIGGAPQVFFRKTGSKSVWKTLEEILFGGQGR